MIKPTDIDWKELAAKVDAEEPTEGWGWDGEPAKTVFLGTVFNLVPSGKYYTPWANSNVTAEEAEGDTDWWTELWEQAASYGLFITSGDGDPCDIMVGKFVEE